jgi:hypothetical protein
MLVSLVVAESAGAFSFSPALGSPFPVAPAPLAVAVGDFNKDGRLDLVTANRGASYGGQSGSVSVLLGNGAGGFTKAPGSPFAVAGTGTPWSVAVGDFNRDGRLDLATANGASNSVSVLLGNGAGGFTPAPGSPFVVGSLPESLVVGDFNRDGRPDLAVANAASDNVSVLLGNGAGGFTKAPGSPLAVGAPGGKPASIAVGDFNRDGRPDLAIANYDSNSVSVLLGNGAGGFTPAPRSPFAVGGVPGWVVVGDFNKDGRLDLATANTVRPATVSVLLGNGAGGFTPAPGSPFGLHYLPRSLAVGDFNRDGRPDLALANQNGHSVSVLLGNGRGGFRPARHSPFGVGRYPDGLVVADFNRDGRPDLATANLYSNDVSVLLNTP